MTSAQKIGFATDTRPTTRGLIAMTLTLLALFMVICLVVYFGMKPVPTGLPLVRAAFGAPPGAAAPFMSRSAGTVLARTEDPACAAALARARASRQSSSQEAIAASTAMLRACDIH